MDIKKLLKFRERKKYSVRSCLDAVENFKIPTYCAAKKLAIKIDIDENNLNTF